MIPTFSPHHQECENCEATIYIGYEFIITDDGYFCSEDCAKCFYYLNANAQQAYLTSDRLYRSVDQ